MPESNPRLLAAATIQNNLLATLLTKCEQIEACYATDVRLSSLREQLKAKIVEAIAALAEGKRLALLLIDLQNDFAIKGGALYVSEGEDVILTNMALLDAVKALLEEQPHLKARLAIITTQDTHRFERSPEHKETRLMEKAYGDQETKIAMAKEHAELLDFDPARAQFGLHCIAWWVLLAWQLQSLLNKGLLNLKQCQY